MVKRMRVNKKALVIGAGLAGCTSARILAEKGYEVSILEGRYEIGGMASDEISKYTYKQTYGPHIWHTSDEEVQAFFERFCEFVPAIHRVRAVVPAVDGLVHFPLTSKSRDDIGAKPFVPSGDCINASSFESYLRGTIGDELYENFIHHYTMRQWGVLPKNISYELAQRVKVNMDKPNAEFFDHEKFVGFPKNGFTKMMKEMIDHPNIDLSLSYSAGIEDIINDNNDIVIVTCSLDDFTLGIKNLDYRHIKFKSDRLEFSSVEDGVLVINNCKPVGEHTRITSYKRIGAILGIPTTNEDEDLVGYEIPVPKDYIGAVPCYPITVVKDVYEKNNKLNDAYQTVIRSSTASDVRFLGRLATYKYLDMHVVIRQVLDELKDL